MRTFLFSVSVLLLSSYSFAETANSSSTLVQVYGAWLSANGDCSSPVEISNSTTATQVDISGSPTLASGKVPAGTYKCLILKIDSLVTFTPATSPGAPCVAGTPVTIKACAQFGMTGSSNTVHTSQDALTGATITCTGNNYDTTGGQQVYLYLSRNSLCNGTAAASCPGTFSNPFLPPTTSQDANTGWKLDNDIVISADTTGNFVFNTDGMVDVLGGHCNLEGFLLGYK